MRSASAAAFDDALLRHIGKGREGTRSESRVFGNARAQSVPHSLWEATPASPELERVGEGTCR